jgi:cytochrome c-type protein NapB
VTSQRRAIAYAVAALVLLVAATTAIASLIVASRRHENARSFTSAIVAAPILEQTDDPIRAEAEVFRTSPASLAIDPSSERERGAHPRTMKTYRGLRAYPGAPPRIPHGLNPEEALHGGCTTCHERGGYSYRFDAYVPITPHPDMGMCLQCHVGDAKLMAIALPNLDPSARCRQCHSSGGDRWKDSGTTFRPIAWKELARVSAGDPPPPIPHTLEMRTNCLSCHAPPSAVAEIRTKHAYRSNCRQCHLENGHGTEEFTRPADRSSPGGGP